MRPIDRRYGVVAVALVAVLISSGALSTLLRLGTELAWSLVPAALLAPAALSVDTNPAVREYFEAAGGGGGAEDPESGGGVDGGGAMRIFSAAELAEYRGEPGQQRGVVMLAVMGKVFDVTSGGKHYGPGGTYSVFAGRDASIAFHTGDSNAIGDGDDDVLTDILTLTRQELAGIQHWAQFYQRQYTFVGVLHGRFYDERGRPTEYLDRVHHELFEHQVQQDDRARWQAELPACNVEWKPEIGTRVWCSAHSGGVRRDWRGVPRKFYEPGQTVWRCACVRPEQRHLSYLEAYEGCGAEESSCIYEPVEEKGEMRSK